MLVSTFRILVVLGDVFAAVAAHDLGADAIAHILFAGLGQFQGPIFTALPDHTPGVDRSKKI